MRAAGERSETGLKRALVVLNPTAGQRAPDDARRTIVGLLSAFGWSVDVHELTGEDDLAGLISDSRREGCDLVVAAGGDGTVAAVGGHLVGTDVPLGIVPLGTGNVLAQELSIPQEPEQAVALLAGAHDERKIDAMRIGSRHYFLQAGLGLDSLTMRDTDREAKRRLGRLAYVITLARKLTGYDAPRFRVVVDGKPRRFRAWQVLVVNAGTLGWRVFHWGDSISPSDGKLDLIAVSVRKPRDYLRLLWHLAVKRGWRSSALKHYVVTQHAEIAADRFLPVQADGEIVGDTALRVEAVPRAVRVVVPLQAGTAPAEVAGRRRAERLLSLFARWLGPVGMADTSVFLAINRMPHPWPLNFAMEAVSTAMSKGAGLAIGLVLASLIDPRSHRRAALEVLPTLWLAGLTVEFPLKRIFGRPRPYSSLVLASVVGKKPGHYSFPSAHTAVAFGGAWLLSQHYPRLTPALYGLATVVGFSRVYLGVHYLSDVVVGAAAGIGLSAAIRYVVPRLVREILF